MQIEKSNSILEDVCALIGYNATCSLVDWFGGGNLHVPAVIDATHPIAKVIGMPAAQRLVSEWGSEMLWLPLDFQRERNRRDRLIGLLLCAGVGAKQIASVAAMSEHHIQKVRAKLEADGLMPLILRQSGLAGESRYKNWAKGPGRRGHRK